MFRIVFVPENVSMNGKKSTGRVKIPLPIKEDLHKNLFVVNVGMNFLEDRPRYQNGYFVVEYVITIGCAKMVNKSINILKNESWLNVTNVERKSRKYPPISRGDMFFVPVIVSLNGKVKIGAEKIPHSGKMEHLQSPVIFAVKP